MKSKTKILYVITKSNYGGAQRYVFDLATSLPKDECEAVVVLGAAQNGAPVLQEKLHGAGVRTIFIPGLSRDISFLKELRVFRELMKVFKFEKPFVVHLNSSKAAGLGALAARLCGTPLIVFTVHGWPFFEERNPLSKLVIRLFSYITVLLSH
ncbi:MAG: glycosyltransferase, partial [bacterium]|nr:glycosyltransferase [bacterium]